MKKLFTVLALMSATLSAHADIAFTKDDLVGDWICQADDEVYSNSALVRYHADGTADEFAEGRFKDNYIPSVENISLHYRWQLKGDKLYMSDYQIGLFEMRDLLPVGLMRVSDEYEAITIAEYEEFFTRDENTWHYVSFHDKDHHRFYYEDGTDGECRRIK